MTQKTVKVEVELPAFDEWEPTGEFRAAKPGEGYFSGGEIWVCSGRDNLNETPIYRRKRWRAEEGCNYWVVLSDGRTGKCTENLFRDDNAIFEYGNYFHTEEQAQAAAEVIKAALAKFHEEWEE